MSTQSAIHTAPAKFVSVGDVLDVGGYSETVTRIREVGEGIYIAFVARPWTLYGAHELVTFRRTV